MYMFIFLCASFCSGLDTLAHKNTFSTQKSALIYVSMQKKHAVFSLGIPNP